MFGEHFGIETTQYCFLFENNGNAVTVTEFTT